MTVFASMPRPNISVLKKRRRERGYTIVELSISVAIAGVLLVSAIGLVQTVLTTQRANDTTTLLSRAMTQIDKIWAESPDYLGLNLAAAGAAGVFSGMQTQLNAAGVLTGVTSRFNRPIHVGVVADLPAAGTNRGYAITFAGLPKSVCADLVSAGVSSGIRAIAITPEAAIGATVAAITGFTMTAAGVVTPPGGTVMALNGVETSMNIGNTTGVAGCGTANGSVALTFINWK